MVQHVLWIGRGLCPVVDYYYGLMICDMTHKKVSSASNSMTALDAHLKPSMMQSSSLTAATSLRIFQSCQYPSLLQIIKLEH